MDAIIDLNSRPRINRQIIKNCQILARPTNQLQWENLANGRALTPEVNNSKISPLSIENNQQSIKKFNNYLVYHFPSSVDTPKDCRAIHVLSGQECILKVMPITRYRKILHPYFILGDHKHVRSISEIMFTVNSAVAVLPSFTDDLHTLIRSRGNLREEEACFLFNQMLSAVAACHENGIIVRDIKLRKFAFTDTTRTHLVLNGLEECIVLDDESDDRLNDKHGSLAYISPEILISSSYSGKMADVWSLGIILYTMLLGQYPFQDNDVAALFRKIRHGRFNLSEAFSAQLRCLLRSMLRVDPSKRITLEEVASHPWLRASANVSNVSEDYAQLVPKFVPPLLQTEEFTRIF